MSETLQLVLTAAQGKLIMTALAERPFKLVYALIGNLNRQANAAGGGDGGYRCLLDAGELRLVLDALGQLPYVEVCSLMHELQLQMQLQVQQLPADGGHAGKNKGTGRKREPR